MNKRVIGEKLGKYRVVREIGAGGMGIVYAAEHEALGKKAAVKVISPELSSNQEVITRFFAEAVAAARIKHAGIFEVFDYGEDSESGWLETLFGIGISNGNAVKNVEPGKEAKLGLGLTADLGLNLVSWKRSDAFRWSLLNLSGGIEFYFHVLPLEENAMGETEKPETLFWFGPYAAQTFHLGCTFDIRLQATFPLKDDFRPKVIYGASIGYNRGASRECKLYQ